jgi:hypothetical protein
LGDSIREAIKQWGARDENKIKCKQKEDNDFREIEKKVEQIMMTWGNEEPLGSYCERKVIGHLKDEIGEAKNSLRIGKGVSSEKMMEESNDKKNKNYKKRRRKRNKMWKYASSMNEFYDLQRKEECCDEKEVLSEEFNCHLREEKLNS